MHGYKLSYIAVQIKFRNTLLPTERLVVASEGRMSDIAERQFTNRRSERLVRPWAGRVFNFSRDEKLRKKDCDMNIRQ